MTDENTNIDELYLTLKSLKETIDLRADEDSANSYTASLLEKGEAKCAQKLGEEAIETVIAALEESNKNVVNEAADLIYHLLVLLKSKNISFENVLKELQKREGISGHVEKASRKG